MRAEAREPSIRGSFISTGKAWIIKTYGPDLFERALTVLPADQQPAYRLELVSTSWYPLEQWTQVLAAVRKEVRTKTGEDSSTFDRRMMFEAISRTMDQIFRIAFSVLSAPTVVAKLTPYFQKVYSHGTYSVIDNKPGHCRLRISEAPLAMESELERAFPIAASWMLDVAGQRVTKVQFVPVYGALLSCDTIVDYEPKKKR